MKTIIRITAVVMIVAIVATLMAACGKYIDERIIGTWVQTDDVDGNWTWTFDKEGKCTLESDTNNFSSEGTYRLEGEGSSKIYITLKEWGEEKIFTYAVTEKVIDLEGLDESYYCKKQ